MKLIVVFLITLFSFSSFSSECNREAQFMGYVKNLKTYPATYLVPEHFTFQVKLGRHFLPSLVCPMWETELEEAVVTIKGRPSISEGDSVSGVMVYDVKDMSYRIED